MADPIVNGVDVSDAQGVLTPHHWAACRKTNEFAIVRRGNGNKEPDGKYSVNLANARNAGLTVGTYHFVFVLPDDPKHPGRSPEEQAAAHASNATFVPGDLIPWADFEWPPAKDWNHWKLPKEGRSDWIADFILRYVNRYTEITGVPMGVYSYPDWIHAAGLAGARGKAELAALPFWRAASVAHKPNVMPGGVGPWTRSDLFQWTGGAVRMPNGTRGDADICLQSRLDWLSILATRQ